jgi:hypothetical protein
VGGKKELVGARDPKGRLERLPATIPWVFYLKEFNDHGGHQGQILETYAGIH